VAKRHNSNVTTFLSTLCVEGCRNLQVMTFYCGSARLYQRCKAKRVKKWDQLVLWAL